MSIAKHLLVRKGTIRTSNALVEWVKSTMRPVNRFLGRVKRLLDYTPVIWSSYDWDHSYATGIFAYQLQRMVDYFEKNQTHVGWENDVSRMKTAIELIKRVDEDYYSLQYYDLLEQKYGKSYLEFTPCSQGGYELDLVFEKEYTPEQLAAIKQEKKNLMNLSRLKQEKARRVLWKFIEHNIENWWA